MHLDLLTLGHGYSAAVLAARLPGWRIAGTTRSADGAAAIAATGVTPILWGDIGAVAAAIAGAARILVTMPPTGGAEPALAAQGAALAAARPDWVGYLSTTGVYGSRDGGWVDEDSPLEPSADRGRWRVGAEAAWTATGLPVEIFRLPGIYGPGRSALDRLREGRAQRIIKPGQVFSRIHVADIAGALAAAIAAPRPGRIVNIADDEPCPPQDVIAYAARLLAMPVPPDIPLDRAELSPMARSFYTESKRISNARMRRDLGFAPAFPNYRVGLRALLAGGA